MGKNRKRVAVRVGFFSQVQAVFGVNRVKSGFIHNRLFFYGNGEHGGFFAVGYIYLTGSLFLGGKFLYRIAGGKGFGTTVAIQGGYHHPFGVQFFPYSVTGFGGRGYLQPPQGYAAFGIFQGKPAFFTVVGGVAPTVLGFGNGNGGVIGNGGEFIVRGACSRAKVYPVIRGDGVLGANCIDGGIVGYQGTARAVMRTFVNADFFHPCGFVIEQIGVAGCRRIHNIHGGAYYLIHRHVMAAPFYHGNHHATVVNIRSNGGGFLGFGAGKQGFPFVSKFGGVFSCLAPNNPPLCGEPAVGF